MKNKERKFPWFWVLYVVYVLALAGTICYGISWLWKFLAVYENTRPVHCMERTMDVFDVTKKEQLQSYMTNTVENPYEDEAVLLSVFYDMIENKTLSFGKLSGKYTEKHPVYAVMAGETHVATVSLVSDNQEQGYGFFGWEIEEITLHVYPTKSFAVTVPSSMSVTVNGRLVAEEHVTGSKETDTPVSYVNYACIGGLYLEPQIVVTDKYGTEVKLQKDEASGGLYYQMSYAVAPTTMELSFGGHVLGEENILEADIPVEEMEVISEVSATFSEYEKLPEILTIPTFCRYYIDFMFDEESIVATDRFGEGRTLAYDATKRLYSHELISNVALEEECTEFAVSFLQDHALFVANDMDETGLKKYFPAKSKFYEKIARMVNIWFAAHTPIEFTDHTVEEFFAYSDDIVYIHVTMNQNFKVLATGKKVSEKINLPLWLVRMDGNWYVARIMFAESVAE